MTSYAKFDTWQSTAGTTRGSVIQVLEFRSIAGDKSVTDTSSVDIITANVMTKANSKLYIIYHTGQMQKSSGQTNPKLSFTIDGIDAGFWGTNHYFYQDGGANTTDIIRGVATLPFISNNLIAGNHVIKVTGTAYNGTITYDYQSSSQPNRRSRMTIMEISG
jgi:hypothetical protein